MIASLLRPARFVGAVAVLLSLIGFAGCVSQDEHKRLQTAFDQARAQLAEAENDLAVARARIAELEGKIAELERLLKGNAGLDGIRRERDLLAAQLADLQKKYNELLALSGTPTMLSPDATAALRKIAEQYPDLMEFDERTGMIRLKSDVTFDLGSTEVKPRAKEVLKKIAGVFNMKELVNQEILVVGHTDDVPIRVTSTNVLNPTNWILSTNRGWSVVRVLHEGGLADNRGQAAGWGDQRPIAPNAAGKRGNEKNRRVEIFVRPTTVPEGIVVSTPGAAPAPRPAPTTRRAPAAPIAPAAPGIERPM